MNLLDVKTAWTHYLVQMKQRWLNLRKNMGYIRNSSRRLLQQRGADGVTGRTEKKKDMMGDGGANAELI